MGYARHEKKKGGEAYAENQGQTQQRNWSKTPHCSWE